MAEHGPEPLAAGAGFEQRMKQVEALVHELERAPDPRLRERAQALVGAVLDLHKAGLARVLEVVERSNDAGRIVDELAADDLVAQVLLLHDLHPVPIDVRVARAIDRVRARAARHGAEVGLVDNRGGRVVVRIAPGAGCGSSPDGIRQMVEEALLADAPDLAELQFETAEPPVPQTFISLQQLKHASAPSTHHQASATAAAVAAPRST